MKFLLNIYEWWQKHVSFPSAFSWETLILLSLFSYYMSALASGFLENLLIHLGWIFLILGVYWGTTSTGFLRIGFKPKERKDGYPLSPWITGALVSVYIFSLETGEVTREALIYWPVISAIIAALPDFIGVGDGVEVKNPPPRNRQNLVVLFGTQFLLSCWFQFYFVLQDWLVQYPSLVVDDFNRSAFVIKWNSPLSPTTPRGTFILDAMEPRLKERLNNKSWPQIERSLLKEQRIRLINTLAKQAKQQLPPVEEDALWQVQSGISSRNSGYNLKLQAIWQGPRSKPQEYSLSKLCQITQIYSRASAAINPVDAQQTQVTVPIGRVDCEPTKGWGIDEPIIANN